MSHSLWRTFLSIVLISNWKWFTATAAETVQTASASPYVLRHASLRALQAASSLGTPSSNGTMATSALPTPAMIASPSTVGEKSLNATYNVRQSNARRCVARSGRVVT